MEHSDEIKRLIASFAEQITPERLEEARAISGIGFMPAGTLDVLLKDHDFSVDDLVTLLLSGWMLQGEELKQQLNRVSELEDLCSHQQQAIDKIADQSTRLRSLVAKISPENEALSSFDMLKGIAQRVERSGTSSD